MKGFALDENGDVLIENGTIQMVHGSELTAQTIKSVFGTQKGEWFLNWEQGINHNEILGKKRYASQNSALDNQYIREINSLKQIIKDHENSDESALNELLGKRLDGVI